MKKRKGGTTARELLNELSNDEDYQKMMREKEKTRFKKKVELAFSEAPIVRELNAGGYPDLASVWDFVNTSVSYSTAIPILLAHLPGDYHPRIKEGIVRALTVKEARGVAVDPLVSEYRKSEDNKEGGYRLVIANALTITADRASIEKVVSIMEIPTHPGIREHLLRAIGKFKSAEATEALQVLAEDSDKLVAAKAKQYLRKHS